MWDETITNYAQRTRPPRASLLYLNEINPGRGFTEPSHYKIAYPDYLDRRASCMKSAPGTR